MATQEVEDGSVQAAIFVGGCLASQQHMALTNNPCEDHCPNQIFDNTLK